MNQTKNQDVPQPDGLNKMTMPHPLFSIVVPTWNRGHLIGETIRSLLHQDFPQSQYEVIVVDDGSTDDTSERLKEFSDRISVFHQPNAGAATARNLGNQHASGEYLVCFDSDDLLLPCALGVYKTVIDAYGQPPVVLAEPIWFHGDLAIDVATRRPSGIGCIRFRDYFGKNARTPISNSFFVINRKLVLSVGGYSPGMFSDDGDLIFKVGTASPLVKIVHPPTVGQRLHGGNIRYDLAGLSRGWVARLRSERRGVYPGGRRRMLDRRGILGSGLISNISRYYLRAQQASLSVRLAHVTTLLLQARGMILAAFLRNLCSRFYAREERSLEYTAYKG